MVLRETKRESFQLSPACLLLYCGERMLLPCRIFSVLMNSYIVMVNNVLVVSATEICITVTIIEEVFL